jgi:uncharacterized coiled-coil protein SlyX
MISQPERIVRLETQVEHITEKIDDLKDCLTDSHNKLIDQLDHVREENTREHNKVMAQLDDLKDFKNKWVWVGGAALTVLSLVFGHLESIIKIITH